MPSEKSYKNFSPNNKNVSGTRGKFGSYGFYSSLVFQMMALTALGFYGGKKLTEHFELETNLLTVFAGFLGLVLGTYSMVKQIERFEKNEAKIDKNTIN